jgi:hypothetical protein
VDSPLLAAWGSTIDRFRKGAAWERVALPICSVSVFAIAIVVVGFEIALVVGLEVAVVAWV